MSSFPLTPACAAAPIYENGTPEQKAKYLPKLLQRRVAGCFRPDRAGRRHRRTGPADHRSKDESGDYWVLNGSKIFITNAGYADVFIVIAVTDIVPDKKGRPTKQCSAFIVEQHRPGLLRR